jgi:cell division protein DivIC
MISMQIGGTMSKVAAKSRRIIKRKIKKRRTGLRLIALVVLLLCGIVFYGRIELNAKMAKSEEKLTSFENQLSKEKEREKEIEEYGVYVHTNEFVEDLAREKLGLVYEDEIIFKSKN